MNYLKTSAKNKNQEEVRRPGDRSIIAEAQLINRGKLSWC